MRRINWKQYIGILWVWLLIWAGPSWGQQLRFHGKIVQAGSGEPVPYASLRLADRPQGVLSNAEGIFAFNIPIADLDNIKSLSISRIGFAPRTLSLEDAPQDPEEPWIIRLEVREFTLNEVIIYSSDLGPRDMVALAFRKRRENYANEPYTAQAFYRHYCREGGRYGRLIEAAVDLYDGKGHRRTWARPARKLGLQIRELRRSVDFTALAGRRHLPIALYPTLAKDYVSYENPLLKHLQDDFFQWEYTDTTYHQGQVLYVVRATGRLNGQAYSAELYIAADTWAIVRIEEQLTRAFRNAQESFRRTDHFVASYALFRGRYYLDYMLNEGEYVRDRYDSLGRVSWQDDHFHHVEIMVNSLDLYPKVPLSGKEPGREALDAMPYHPEFWETYSVLQATPLEQKIARDLADRVNLQQQFAAGDEAETSPAFQDQLDQRQLSQLQAKYAGHLTVLCFWDGAYKPGVQTLLRGRKLYKTYYEKPPGLIFISLEATEAAWLAAIRKKQLYLGSHMRLRRGLQSPIAAQYGVTGSPTFILLGPDGTELMRTEDLPKVKEIEKVLNGR